ncbi:MAG: entericidin [Proteobacteria bacterium]|nr:entericidin [Pseudomonadota bacterium]
MKTRNVVLTITLLAFLAGMFSAMSGCNTWRGAGKDVEKMGDAMQK